MSQYFQQIEPDVDYNADLMHLGPVPGPHTPEMVGIYEILSDEKDN